MAIVVDASVTLSWCFPDEQTSLSLTVLDRLNGGEEALVPAFWCVEVLDSLLVGEKRGRISPDQTQAFLRHLAALQPVVDHAVIGAGVWDRADALSRSWTDALRCSLRRACPAYELPARHTGSVPKGRGECAEHRVPLTLPKNI
jgi:predicted nucleic acid-binding protein